MKTVRMYGRTVTLHSDRVRVTIKHGAENKEYTTEVSAHTNDEARAKALHAFRTAHPDATINWVNL